MHDVVSFPRLTKAQAGGAGVEKYNLSVSSSGPVCQGKQAAPALNKDT
jgi:hypothetical protein